MSDDRPRRAEGVVARRNEGLLYDSKTGRLHALNPSAMAIWEACDGATSVEELAAAVSELSRLPPDEVGAQIETAVAELRRNGLVEPRQEVS